MQAYIAAHPWALDEEAIAALRGADNLVIESFLQVTEGHVVRWANYDRVLDRRACSRATVGLISRLEHVRQLNKGVVRFPRGLVPFVCV